MMYQEDQRFPNPGYRHGSLRLVCRTCITPLWQPAIKISRPACYSCRRASAKPRTCFDCGVVFTRLQARRCDPCNDKHREFMCFGRGQLQAQQIAQRAVRKGLIPSPKGQRCTDCAKPAVEYDHRDYGRPLDVQAVCRSCNLKRGPAKPHPDMRELMRHHVRTLGFNRWFKHSPDGAFDRVPAEIRDEIRAYHASLDHGRRMKGGNLYPTARAPTQETA